MTISDVADICFLFVVILLRRIIHTTPIAAIKHSAPPTAAPIIMLRFLLTDSLPELELKLLALIVLEAVFPGAVSSRERYVVENDCYNDCMKTKEICSVSFSSVCLESLDLCGRVVQYDSFLYDRKTHSKLSANSNYLY